MAGLAITAVALGALLVQRELARNGYSAENFSPPDFSDVVQKVMPSLVKVENEGLAGHPDLTGSGNDIEIAETREGTGFFVNTDGLILTNYHVIEDAQTLNVITKDQKSYPAKVVGADILSDVALIQIKPDFKVKPVKMGDSTLVKVGQWVLAMGNPLGLDFFSSAGIVSGFGPPGPNYIGFYDFIQADLNIQPGNSGGPLLNHKGEVVGINNSYLGPGTGIGFAIPINRVKDVMDELIKNGRISRGFLGMIGQPLTAGLAERLSLKDMRGALVSEVIEGSPAEKNGLKPRDVVLEFNGQEVANDRTLQEKVYASPADTNVDLLIVRDGRNIHLPVVLGELEAHTLVKERVIMQCGITLEPIPEEVAKKLGVTDNTGLMVLKVVPGCPAFEGGLRFGDIIKKVEGEDIRTVSDFYRVYSGMRPGKQILVKIMREGRPLFVTIRQEKET